MAFLHGRHIGPLLTVWAGGLLVAAALYWLQAVMPALVDMVTPMYIALAAILLIATSKWIRARGEQRRHADRRHRDRRHDTAAESEVPPIP